MTKPHPRRSVLSPEAQARTDQETARRAAITAQHDTHTGNDGPFPGCALCITAWD